MPSPKPMDSREIEARKLVLRFHYVVSQLGNVWKGSAIEFPDISATGFSPEKCIRAVQDVIAEHILKLIERRGNVPEPNIEWQKAFVKKRPEDQILSGKAPPSG